eukprot:TRINITY_DN5580_c0_g1_i1.p1 TRINITY_DN5580_c0_g1~~TRINITY_DN5580_c0_g1_i1.p1  ORF type:complete len:756 (-),score=227.40 TRINITY_DN5580_c0_g1_i1:14-2281(-)
MSNRSTSSCGSSRSKSKSEQYRGVLQPSEFAVIVAQNIYVHGFATLLGNLVNRAEVNPKVLIKKHGADPVAANEYVESTKNKLGIVSGLPKSIGYDFPVVARSLINSRSEAMLVGIYRNNPGHPGALINPGRTTIQSEDQIYAIAYKLDEKSKKIQKHSVKRNFKKRPHLTSSASSQSGSSTPRGTSTSSLSSSGSSTSLNKPISRTRSNSDACPQFPVSSTPLKEGSDRSSGYTNTRTRSLSNSSQFAPRIKIKKTPTKHIDSQEQQQDSKVEDEEDESESSEDEYWLAHDQNSNHNNPSTSSSTSTSAKETSFASNHFSQMSLLDIYLATKYPTNGVSLYDRDLSSSTAPSSSTSITPSSTPGSVPASYYCHLILPKLPDFSTISTISSVHESLYSPCLEQNKIWPGAIIMLGNLDKCNILADIIFHLRRDYMVPIKPIILMSKKEPREGLRKQWFMFPKVYWVQGDAFDKKDLIKTGIGRPEGRDASIVIFTKWLEHRPHQPKPKKEAKKEKEMKGGNVNIEEEEESVSKIFRIVNELLKEGRTNTSGREKIQMIFGKNWHSPLPKPTPHMSADGTVFIKSSSELKKEQKQHLRALKSHSRVNIQQKEHQLVHSALYAGGRIVSFDIWDYWVSKMEAESGRLAVEGVKGLMRSGLLKEEGEGRIGDVWEERIGKGDLVVGWMREGKGGGLGGEGNGWKGGVESVGTQMWGKMVKQGDGDLMVVVGLDKNVKSEVEKKKSGGVKEEEVGWLQV